MRAYVAHNMDENEDLLANLEKAKSEAAATQKLVEEGVGLLKKAEEEVSSWSVSTNWWESGYGGW